MGISTKLEARASSRMAASRSSSSTPGGVSVTAKSLLLSWANTSRQSDTRAAMTRASGSRFCRARSWPHVWNDPCASRSIPTASSPSSLAATSKLVARVLFPTPPLGAKMVRVRPGRSMRAFRHDECGTLIGVAKRRKAERSPVRKLWLVVARRASFSRRENRTTGLLAIRQKASVSCTLWSPRPSQPPLCRYQECGRCRPEAPRTRRSAAPCRDTEGAARQ